MLSRPPDHPDDRSFVQIVVVPLRLFGSEALLWGSPSPTATTSGEGSERAPTAIVAGLKRIESCTLHTTYRGSQ
jgi:hypothetical protein